MSTQSKETLYFILYNYLEFSGIALFFYDYILTLPREISILWQWPTWPLRLDRRGSRWKIIICVNISSLLYFTTRYPLLLAWSLKLWLSLYTTKIPNCSQWLRFEQTSQMTSQLTVALILLLRVYALFNKSRLILLIGGVMWSTLVGIGIWSIVLSDCNFTFDASRFTAIKIATMLYSLMSVITDTFVIIPTVVRFAQIRQFHGSGEGSLIKLVIRNGCLYYISLFAINLTMVIMYFCAPIELIGCGNHIAFSLSANIIAHFLISLREHAYTSSTTSTMWWSVATVDPASESTLI